MDAVTLIETLMSRFEGLDDYTPADQMPTCRLFAARHLARLRTAEGDPFLEKQVLDLVVEACLWHAHAHGKRWNPLEVTFADFQQEYGNDVRVWEDDDPYPPPEQLQAWIFGSPDEQ